MKQTTFEEFVELARRGTFVPVVKEIIADLLTPVSAFLKIAEHSDYAFLFESVEGGEQVARYSFLGKDPFLVLRGARRQDHARALGDDDRERGGVRAGAAPADGRTAVAVRARAAAIHGRRRRFHRLRRLADLRAGARRRPGQQATAARKRRSRRWRRRRCRLHAVRHRAGVRPREAPDPDHRQRAHHRGRGSARPLSVRVRQDPVPRTRARARVVAARAR